MVKLYFCGGAGVVTGVNYLLETAKSKILIDCGLFQGEKNLEKKNYEPFAYDPKEIDAVIISHSHLDHIGRLPQLVSAGFRGKIFATPPTVDFTRLILEDSAKVLREKAKREGILPLFLQDDVDEVMRCFRPVDYYKKTKAAEGISFTFHEAGHILGSALIELNIQNPESSASPRRSRGRARNGEIKIVFSGDLGNPPAPLLRPPDFLSEADYVLVESTYGDKNHESPQECRKLVENVVEAAITRRGALLVPSFAMERTQQLLYHFNELVEQHKIPVVPIYIDSPLALRITDVYKQYPQYFNQEAVTEIKSGDDIFNFPGLHFTQTVRQSKAINDAPLPKVIIAGSGMSNGGRIVHHESLYLSDPKTTLLLVTYQAEGTLGRLLASGAKEVDILDKRVTVNARIEKISGYSAHADQQFLMDWLKHFQKSVYGVKGTLKKIFVVQGEEKPAKTLAGLARDELGIEAVVPAIGETVELL